MVRNMVINIEPGVKFDLILLTFIFIEHGISYLFHYNSHTDFQYMETEKTVCVIIGKNTIF